MGIKIRGVGRFVIEFYFMLDDLKEGSRRQGFAMDRYYQETGVILFVLYLGCRRNRVGIKL